MSERSESNGCGTRYPSSSTSFAALQGVFDFGLLFRPNKKSFAKASETSLLYAKAFPEPVFRYSSKSLASFSVKKAPYQTNFQGKYGFVDLAFPVLCKFSLNFKSLVEPK